MSDLVAMNLAIRQKVRADVAAINYDATADALPEQLRQVATKPAIYVMIRIRAAEELSPGIRSQRVDLDFLVGLVTQSLIASAAVEESEALKQQIVKSLHWWELPGVLGRLRFRGEPSDPVHEGSSIGTQLLFQASMQETWT